MKLLKILSIIGLLSTLGSAHAGCSASDCKKTALDKTFDNCFKSSDDDSFKKLVTNTNKNCATEFITKCTNDKSTYAGCAKVKACKESNTCLIEDPKEKELNTALSKDNCLKKAKEKAREFNLAATYPIGTVCQNYEACLKSKSPKTCYTEVIASIGSPTPTTSHTPEKLTEEQYKECEQAQKDSGSPTNRLTCPGYLECVKKGTSKYTCARANS